MAVAGNNLLFHGLIPLMAFVTFILSETEPKVKLLDTAFYRVPVLLYRFFYRMNLHSEWFKEANITIGFHDFTSGGNQPFIVMAVAFFGICVRLCYPDLASE